MSPIGPQAVRVGSRHLELDGDWVASFAVTGFPREVHPGWLAPLTGYPGRLDVSLHIEPIDPATAASRLQRQLARLESNRRHRASYGRVEDPQVDAASEDAHDLAARIARGEARLFRVGLLLTVHAASEAGLADEVASLRALTASLLLDAHPTSFRALQGWVSCLPVGLDRIRLGRVFDTDSLAAAFPFASPELPPPDPAAPHAVSGVFYGYNLGAGGGLVFFDRFAPDAHNYNTAVLGRSGSGKSYLVKLDVLRSLFGGVEAAVIDPEDEYRRLADAVGGTHLRLGAPGVRLNPLDLPAHRDPTRQLRPVPDALTQAVLFTQTVVAVLLGGPLSAAARAALDRAIATAYRHAGIGPDPRSWTRPAPTLRHVRDALARNGGDRHDHDGHGPHHNDRGDPAARELADQLGPFVDGASRGLFDGPTTVPLDGHLAVISLRELPEELKPVGTLLALQAVWRRVTNPYHRRPRLVVVDEAWLLMRDPEGAKFLFRLAKSARKHWCGLAVATQDSDDLLASQLGRAVIANSATQILLRQAPQAIAEVTRAFGLSEGEAQFLLSAERGHGLLLGARRHGEHRVAFAALASDTDHDLVTSDPADLESSERELPDVDLPESPRWDLDEGNPDKDDWADEGESDNEEAYERGWRYPNPGPDPSSPPNPNPADHRTGGTASRAPEPWPSDGCRDDRTGDGRSDIGTDIGTDVDADVEVGWGARPASAAPRRQHRPAQPYRFGPSVDVGR